MKFNWYIIYREDSCHPKWQLFIFKVLITLIKKEKKYYKQNLQEEWYWLFNDNIDFVDDLIQPLVV